ncbi:hemerythrin domain-containing protein [Gallibacterium anatis]|uniref:hemerythrin domain-containing protein n=1 Tax=Gallibacterium anatis TaxID=750 RepID=UPI00053197EC|nr:hemerythrin domain-containing protein [Gallibacterium anatis]KGQ43330.1 hypothetical protein JP29_10960 [Gallibacterium anatis]KGQ67917.1 hypothetical protein IO47_07495 [Gallibacterium anatis]
MMLYKPSHPHSLLQDDQLFLLQRFPQDKWRMLPSFSGAAGWLGMHDSLRFGQGMLDHLGRQYLEQKLDWETFRQRLLHEAYLHYGHLDGHHRLEDDEHFPKMRLQQPKLASGFDLLENDHHQIAERLSEVDRDLLRLRQTQLQPSQQKWVDQLIDNIKQSGELLYRHLADEEDLVIPLLALQSETE